MIKPPSAPIPLSQAEVYTQNWRDFNGSTTVNGVPLSSYLANAFTFDLQDIYDLMSESGITNVRFYFGYDSNEPAPGLPIPMKVMLVGVDAEGKDMIYPAESSSASGIYDFAIPCPSVCDTSSPLS